MDGVKEVRTIKYKNVTSRVIFPDITQEERARRLKEVERCAINLLIAEQELERKKEEQKKQSGQQNI